MSELIFELNKKMRFFYQNSLLTISSLLVAGLIVRILYADFEIPLSLDSLEYFVYAVDISRIGHLPELYSPANNGWAIFLGMIFSIIEFDNALNYMQMQKIISIIFSSITIIPIYYLIRQFFDKKFAILGISIFAFEPKIIMNSVIGIADPLYIFLISVSFAIVFNKKFSLVGFVIISIATMVRPEGIFVFGGIFIIYILKNKENKKILLTSILAIIIFISILSPMMIYKNSIHGDDRIFGRISETIDYHTKPPEETNQNSGGVFILKGIENTPKYLGWSMIPIFILLVPIGIIILLKEDLRKNYLIIIPTITTSIPIFYVYSIPLLETRYTLFLFPLFCLIAIFSLKNFIERSKNQNLLILSIFLIIVITNLIFLDYNKMDYSSEKNSLAVSKFIFFNANAVNSFDYGKFLKSTEVIENWPNLPKMLPDGHILAKIPKIPIFSESSIEQFVLESSNKGLTHIVINSKNNDEAIYSELIINEEKYNFLEKVFEKEINEDTIIKIFRINYEKIKV